MKRKLQAFPLLYLNTLNDLFMILLFKDKIAKEIIYCSSFFEQEMLRNTRFWILAWSSGRGSVNLKEKQTQKYAGSFLFLVILLHMCNWLLTIELKNPSLYWWVSLLFCTKLLPSLKKSGVIFLEHTLFLPLYVLQSLLFDIKSSSLPTGVLHFYPTHMCASAQFPLPSHLYSFSVSSLCFETSKEKKSRESSAQMPSFPHWVWWSSPYRLNRPEVQSKTSSFWADVATAAPLDSFIFSRASKRSSWVSGRSRSSSRSLDTHTKEENRQGSWDTFWNKARTSQLPEFSLLWVLCISGY